MVRWYFTWYQLQEKVLLITVIFFLLIVTTLRLTRKRQRRHKKYTIPGTESQDSTTNKTVTFSSMSAFNPENFHYTIALCFTNKSVFFRSIKETNKSYFPPHDG